MDRQSMKREREAENVNGRKKGESKQGKGEEENGRICANCIELQIKVFACIHTSLVMHINIYKHT